MEETRQENKYLKSMDPVYRSLVMKAYYEAHKEAHKKKCREQAMERYKNDKEHRLAKIEYGKKRMKERGDERVTCDVCGYEINKSSMSKHLKTKVHSKNLEKRRKEEEIIIETEVGYEGSDEEPCITPRETSE